MPGLIAQDVSQLMRSFRQGDQQAAKLLVDLLYPELRRIAARQMRRERADHTWQPTVLVNELYLELIRIRALKPEQSAVGEKEAFLRLAAHLMKRLLIHHSRPLYRRIEKVPLTSTVDSGREGTEELMEIDTALSRLEAVSPRLRTVVELKVFEGLTGVEIAQRLGCGPATVARDWNFARHWLQEELQP
ncbi:MAG: sigma-70 family RNA polymerase sigma factor [Bryobacteraceae bacterium]|nr:sigma-70 family RNA polymerase sigma factor [Bryobacteraceae bacterium]